MRGPCAGITFAADDSLLPLPTVFERRQLRRNRRKSGMNLNGDGIVNLADFAILAQEWSP
ncbi:MAG: hypothetical protein ACYTEK_20600 [Planctomycetota bacterium]